MKFRILKPFIFQAFYAIFLFVAIPLILLWGPWVEIEIADIIGFVFIIIGSILYLNIILFEIVPGLCALFDLLTNNFQTQKMVFIQGYADRRRLLATKEKKNRRDNLSPQRGILETYKYAFFDFQFSTSNGKELFYATSMANLTPNQSYTVQYGTFSKVIVSIVDDKGTDVCIK